MTATDRGALGALDQLRAGLFGTTPPPTTTDVQPRLLVAREGGNPVAAPDPETAIREWVRELLGHPGVQYV